MATTEYFDITLGNTRIDGKFSESQLRQIMKGARELAITDWENAIKQIENANKDYPTEIPLMGAGSGWYLRHGFNTAIKAMKLIAGDAK
jgi:hypothetical protein